MVTNTILSLRSALNIMKEDIVKIDDNEEYLVFGSFLVVEKFLHLIGINEK